MNDARESTRSEKKNDTAKRCNKDAVQNLSCMASPFWVASVFCSKEAWMLIASKKKDVPNKIRVGTQIIHLLNLYDTVHSSF